MQLLQSQDALFSYRTPVMLAQALCTFLPRSIHQHLIDRLLGLNTSFLALSLGWARASRT